MNNNKLFLINAHGKTSTKEEFIIPDNVTLIFTNQIDTPNFVGKEYPIVQDILKLQNRPFNPWSIN